MFKTIQHLFLRSIIIFSSFILSVGLGIWGFTFLFNATPLTQADQAGPFGLDFTFSDNGTPLEMTDDYYIVSKGSFSGTSLIIPELFTGLEGTYPVREIAENGFSNITYLLGVTIPNSVIVIGNYAFQNCNYIGSLVIPNSVTTIGDYAFENCTGLVELLIPESVTSIGIGAFKDCQFYEITLPNSVTSISDYLFYGCSTLFSFTISNSITSIGQYAFADTPLSSIVIPNSVTYIDNYAFYTPLLKSVKIERNDLTAGDLIFGGEGDYHGELKILVPPSAIENYKTVITGLSYYADIIYSLPTPELAYTYNSGFDGYYVYPGSIDEYDTNITIAEEYDDGVNGLRPVMGVAGFQGNQNIQTVLIPDSVIIVDNVAFQNCTGLEEVILSKNLIGIYSYAFSGCTSLTEITIPNGVTTIGNETFFGCTSLTSISIPQSMQIIGDAAFQNCYNLATVKVFSFTPNLILIDYWTFADAGRDSGFQILVPSEAVGTFQSTGNWAVYSSSISGLEISSNLVFNWNGLNYNVSIGSCADSEVVVPSSHDDGFHGPASVVTISNFYSSNLKTVLIPDTVTTIGSRAFQYCLNLTSVVFSSTSALTYIGYAAFSGCTSLARISLPSSVNTIESDAFEVSGLTSITIPNNVSILETGLFNYCLFLTSVTLPTSLTQINSAVFRHCINLASIEIPNTVTFIGGNVFAQCYSLTSIVIPNSVTTMESESFFTCINLSSVLLSSNLTAINSTTFMHCTNLTSIIIPEGVTSIGLAAFAFSGLTSITLPSSLETLEPAVFGFTNITSIEIQEGMTSIGDLAFSGSANLSEVVLPSTLTSVGNGAFENCSDLTSITLPSTITSIGNFAFANSGLTLIEIPQVLTTLGHGVFYQCTDLAFVKFLSTTPPSAGDFIFGEIDALNENFKIIVPSSSYLLYTSASGFSLYEDYIVGYVNLTYTWNDVDGYSVRMGGCEDSEIVIASEWDDGTHGTYPVKSIEYQGFTNQDLITSVFIPNTIISIEASAFSFCDSLTSVIFESGSTITVINTDTFYYCSSLSSITIPSTVQTIDSRAFFSCSSLTTINIPSSVTIIETDAFASCTALTSIVFEGISQLTEIGGSSFYNCSSLASLTIPQNVTVVGGGAFYNTTALTQINYNATSITSFSSPVFSNAGSLGAGITVTFGSNVQTIPYQLFHSPFEPVKVTQVIFDDEANSALTTIANEAFSYCTSLTEMTIPKNVTTIGQSAFYNTIALTTLNFNATNLNDLNITDNIFTQAGINGEGITVYIGANVQKIPSYLFNSYFNPKVINVFFEIDSVCSSIGNYAFYNIDDLKEIYLPNSITSIGSYAFNDCLNLESVTFEQNSILNIIETGAFTYCSSLISFEIPNSVTSIGEYAFSNCISLLSITIPEELTTLSNGVFNYLYALITINFNAINMGDLMYPGFTQAGIYGEGITVNIGNNVTRIPNYFFEAFNIISVIFEEGSVCASIGEQAFYNCANLTSIAIPNSVTSIEQRAFEESGIINLTFEQNSQLTSIGYRVFRECYNLTSVIIPRSVTSIESEAFQWNSNLSSVTFESNSLLTTISDTVFTGCSSLTSIDIPNSVTSIGWAAFALGSLTTVFIPENLTSIGWAAFACSTLTSFSVDPNNLQFSSIDGILYNKSQTTIVQYPCARTGVFEIPSYVTSIGDGAFGLSSLTSVIIPNTITEIGMMAFLYSLNMSEITIPDSVVSIGMLAFNASSIRTIKLIGETPAMLAEQGILGIEAMQEGFSVPEGLIFFVPLNAVTAYRNADIWTSYSSYIFGGVFVTAYDTEKTYGDDDPSFDFDAFDVNGTDISSSVTFTGALSRESGDNIGGYEILIGTLETSNPSDYHIFFEGATLTIEPKLITIIGNGSVTKTYDGTTDVLPGTITSENYILLNALVGDDISLTWDLDPSLSYYDSQNITANSVTIGGVSLVGAQSGNYILDVGVTSFTVNGIILQKELLVEWGVLTFNWTGNPILPTASVDSGILGENLTIVVMIIDTITGGDDPINPFGATQIGTYLIEASLQDDGIIDDNYLLTNIQTILTITEIATINVTWIGTTFVYNGTIQKPIARVTIEEEEIDLEDVTVSGTGNGIEVGTYVATASYSGYVLGPASIEFEITPATLTINGDEIVTKIYDGTNTAIIERNNYVLSEIFNSDIVDLVITESVFDDDPVGTGKNVGTGKTVIISYSGVNNLNYFMAPGQLILVNGEITPVEITSVTGSSSLISKIYDATNTASILRENYVLNSVFGTDDVNLNITDATYSNFNAGTNRTVVINYNGLTGDDSGNYLLNSGTLTLTGIIERATLTVIAGEQSINEEYDGDDIVITNLIAGTHYIFSPSPFGEDVVNLNISSKIFEGGSNVGSGKTVVVNFIGVNNTNYSITAGTVNIFNCSITPKILEVTDVGIVEKTYDNSINANITDHISILGVIEGEEDLIGLNWASAIFDSKNCIDASQVAVSGLYIENNNYSLMNTSCTISAKINPKVLFVTGRGDSSVIKVFDGTNNASANITSDNYDLDESGVFEEDRENFEVLGYIAYFSDFNAGIELDVTVESLQFSNTNYTTEGFILENAGTIEKKQVTVIAKSITITSDKKPKLVYTVQDENGDIILVSLEGDLYCPIGDEPGVGEYEIQQGTLTNANNPNFNINYVAAKLVVIKYVDSGAILLYVAYAMFGAVVVMEITSLVLKSKSKKRI